MDLIGAIDQGTSSTRFLVFDVDTGTVVVSHQIEIKQYFPNPGWVEIDPEEIIRTIEKCIDVALKRLEESKIDKSRIRAVGLASQRETTIVWDCETGKPLYNAIVWLDGRTAKLSEFFLKNTSKIEKDRIKYTAGLPISPYFSALKIHWLLQNVQSVKEAKDRGTLMFGNVDSWVLWNLTGKHVTDVTNASRTLLFDLGKLKWSSELCQMFEIPMSILPIICSSAEVYGQLLSGPLKGTMVSGILGDQQAALVGHYCLSPGDIKNTYGTGTFLLCNVGNKPVFSEYGLLSTVAFQLGRKADVYYALEGSGSIGGNVIRFLRDNLSLFKKAADCEELAKSVQNSEGVVFVPCFTGLYSPYWDSTARGALLGMTQFTGKAHITRAALEAVCFQTADLLDAVQKDLINVCTIRNFKVDGGMTRNSFFNQIQSNIIGMDLITSEHPETTALGAAMAAAVGIGLKSFDDYVSKGFSKSTVYSPNIDDLKRRKDLQIWRNAVQRTRNWITEQCD